MSTIRQTVPYGPFVEKMEFANHACKGYQSHLERLAADHLEFCRKGGLTKRAILRLVVGVEMHSKTQNIQQLRHDLRNGPEHVFGFHQNCNAAFSTHEATNHSTPVQSSVSSHEDSVLSSAAPQEDFVLSSAAPQEDSILPSAAPQEDSVLYSAAPQEDSILNSPTTLEDHLDCIVAEEAECLLTVEDELDAQSVPLDTCVLLCH